MKPRLRHFSVKWPLGMMVAVVVFTGSTIAQTERVLYNFLNQADGFHPQGNLLPDGAGGFYATVIEGGTTDCDACGAVIHLTPPTQAGASWNEAVIYDFNKGRRDGNAPQGNLVKDSAGNLYGTTLQGGPQNAGTVYQLSPPAQSGDPWTETLLHTFSRLTTDGNYPVAGLVSGPGGVLYGTTFNGGTHYEGLCNNGCGAVFQLTPPSQPGDPWTESVIYSFTTLVSNLQTYMTLVVNRGHLLGTTQGLGNYASGAVFELSPPSVEGDEWNKRDIYSFSGGADGSAPSSGVIFDRNGNVYGTTLGGGAFGLGEVFQLVPPGQQGGVWTLNVLHSFVGGEGEGENPQSPLAFDSVGNLYGVTPIGGILSAPGCQNRGCGVAFKLSPETDGTWTQTILRQFGPNHDGTEPATPLTVRGNTIYGQTFTGGQTRSSGHLGLGTVYAIRQ
jgi:uncharacterized repeat protein (TIGR03803 family)